MNGIDQTTINGGEEHAQWEARLGAYLTKQWKRPIKVVQLAQIPGGAARGTWRCDAIDSGRHRGLIVRIASGPQLHLSDDKAEFLVTKAVFDAGLPVPEPLFLEEESRWIGYTFSITQEVSDCKTSADDIPDAHRAEIARQKWTILGDITKLDLVETGLTKILPAATVERCASD